MTLKQLLETNPDWPGSLTNQQALDWLKETVSVNRDSVTGNEMFSATDAAEFDTMSDNKKLLWVSYTTRDDVDPFDPAAVAFVQYVFGAGSATVANLQALRTEDVPRWTQASDLRVEPTLDTIAARR